MRFMRRVYPIYPAPQYRQTLETLAYHEASHAVFMDAVGVPYVGIELNSDGGRVVIDVAAVRASPSVTLNKDAADLATCQLVAMYSAGIQGELLFLGLTHGGGIMPDDTDHRMARRMLMDQFGSVSPLGFCQRVARAVLTQRWPDVEELASRLLKERRIASYAALSRFDPVVDCLGTVRPDATKRAVRPPTDTGNGAVSPAPRSAQGEATAAEGAR